MGGLPQNWQQPAKKAANIMKTKELLHLGRIFSLDNRA